jgi:hypothetical protein
LRHRKNLGERKQHRVELHRSAFLIPMPEAPWLECSVRDVSQGGLCLDVGATPVPEVFGVCFTPGGGVVRLCLRIWRQGALVGARFTTPRELKERARGAAPSATARQKQPTKGQSEARNNGSLARRRADTLTLR